MRETAEQRFRRITGIDRAANDALTDQNRRSLDGLDRRKDVRWEHMTIGLRGESKTGEKVALSLAGKPTRTQLRALLALLAKETE
jgi:hypothetical protein